MIVLYYIEEGVFFFLVDIVLDEFNGLLVFGGDFSFVCLFFVYLQGIFFWFSDDELLLWWLFDFRVIIEFDNFVVLKSFKKFV